MGCEGSRVTDEERAEMQHNLGLDHIPSVHLHPHHGHHHLEGFKPNELAHSAHKTHHNDPHLHKGYLPTLVKLLTYFLSHLLDYNRSWR